MKIGYARVSMKWYQSELQFAALKHEGCDRIWKENYCGGNFNHDQFIDLISSLSSGDTLVATRLSSVANSVVELVLVLRRIHEAGAYFKSLEEPWMDTKRMPASDLITCIEGLRKFETELKVLPHPGEDSRSVPVGVSPGRPRKLNELQKLEALAMLKLGRSAAEISRLFDVSRSTISRLKSK